MKALSLALPGGKRALYLRIADAIRAAVKSGQLRAGERIPSTRTLSRSLHAHRQTVMVALAELVAEGWLLAQPRRGYVVCHSLPDDFIRSQARAAADSVPSRMRWKLSRDVRLAPASPRTPARYSFRSHPDLRLFPFSDFRACINEALRRSGVKLLGYGDPAGHPALQAELEIYLRRVRALTRRKVLVTHGSQEAIFLAGQLLLSPGDEVVVEARGYPPAHAAFRAAGARVVPVPIDDQGLVPAAFEAQVAKRRPRLLYLTPLHQFPTTVTLPATRRLAIYAIAARHRIAILEDDYDHEFHYRSQPLAPMASDDPYELVIYVSSFSKVLFPSARVGFMAVPDVLYEPLRGLRRLVSHQNDFLMQDALARWMRAGGFERHLRKMRRVYEARRDAMNAYLLAEKSRGHTLEWRLPDGGMAIWVRTAVDAERTWAEATRLGIEPHTDELERAAPSNFLRLGFSKHSPSELRSGLALLMTAIARASTKPSSRGRDPALARPSARGVSQYG